MIRKWHHSLPWCRWLLEFQPLATDPVVYPRLGFRTVRFGIVPEDRRYCPRLVRAIFTLKSVIRLWAYPPRVRRNRDFAPRGNSRRAPGALQLDKGGQGDPLTCLLYTSPSPRD